MQNKTRSVRFVRATIVAFTMLAMVFSAGPAALACYEDKPAVKPYNQNAKPAQAKLVNIERANIFVNLAPGSVFKGRNNPALYYLNEDGSRRVFPNEATYMSWYDDFSDVVEVDDSQLADYPLRGNVRYKPGSFLVKVQTDPKVYAVDHNGILRWIKTEKLARQLYGDNWNKLIDDIPAAFFVNYRIGELVDEISDFDPVLAEEIESITENLKEKIQEKIEEKLANQRFRYCKNLKKHLAKLQKRLAKWDLDLESFDDGFMDRCMNNETDDDDDDEPIDATAPVISGITVTLSASSSVITWTTDEISDGKVEYATDHLASATTTTTVNGSNDTTSHLIVLEPLEPETTYYYMVEAEDNEGNVATSTEMSFTTDVIVVPDTTAPIISDIVSTPSSTTALISWTTDEAANSRIEYATDNLDSASTTFEFTDNAFVTGHSFELTDLATSTIYYFIVESADEVANTATSTEKSFTTL